MSLMLRPTPSALRLIHTAPQGSLILNEYNTFLFAVNAGSNEISAFAAGPSGLTLVDKVPSGGVRPITSL
jgi:hypothetical protein